MAITTLKTTIQLRYDTHENWTNNNPVLKKGEVALVSMPEAADSITQVPATLIKVGDGTNDYTTLPFLTAIAGDIYSWAKGPTKPTYTASEISELDTFITSHVTDSDTKYKISIEGQSVSLKANDGKGGEDYTDVDGSPITIPSYDDSALKALINGKQDKLVFNTEYNSESNKAATMSDITAAVAGLSGAMHWKGEVASIPDGDGEGAYKAGDVITIEGQQKEYAFDGTSWVELGDESSHHTHSNKSALDKITDEKITNWDAAKTQSDTNKTNIESLQTDLEGKADTTHTHDIKDLNQTVVLVLDCGDSTEPTVG